MESFKAEHPRARRSASTRLFGIAPTFLAATQHGVALTDRTQGLTVIAMVAGAYMLTNKAVEVEEKRHRALTGKSNECAASCLGFKLYLAASGLSCFGVLSS